MEAATPPRSRGRSTVDALEGAAAVETVAGLAARLDALRADAVVEAELKRLRDRLA